MAEPRRYRVQLVQGPDATSSITDWLSPNGSLPNVGDVIFIADGSAHVTDVWPDQDVKIRAELL